MYSYHTFHDLYFWPLLAGVNGQCHQRPPLKGLHLSSPIKKGDGKVHLNYLYHESYKGLILDGWYQ